jgi:uncharacterized RDD family membrane protein YckC
MNNYPIYAGFWRRAAAIVVDSLILGIPLLVIDHLMLARGKAAFLLSIVAGLFYYAGLHSSKLQATVGKLAFGIKVIDLEGKRIGIGRAVGRYFATWLSTLTLCIGWLMAGLTPRRQALHDMISKTLVVDSATEPEQLADANGVMEVTWPVWVTVIVFFALPFVGGILAAITVPVYQDRVTRAQVVQVMVQAEGVKKEVADAIVTRQPLRTGPRPGSSPLVKSINVEPGGQIIITFTESPLNNGKVFLEPLSVKTGEWRCWSEGVPPKYMGSVCTGQ